MNLRQKCKRLKQENERLKNTTVKPVLQVDQYDVQTFQVERYIRGLALQVPKLMEIEMKDMTREIGIGLYPI